MLVVFFVSIARYLTLWGAQAANPFFSAAWRRFIARERNCIGHPRMSLNNFQTVVGKLPTTAGWQPALSGIGIRIPRPRDQFCR
jgi:hypothetical protein